ncbi:hypothetical protein, partial [Bacillus mycoides]|uniref:hypothetical protein n=1 Tax=Bacillus mycoides TaxID=1405 RepID=UPI003A80ACDC
MGKKTSGGGITFFSVCLIGVGIVGLFACKYTLDYIEAREIVKSGEVHQMKVLEKEMNATEKSWIGEPVYQIKLENGGGSQVLE